jgi:hypothetical protein
MSAINLRSRAGLVNHAGIQDAVRKQRTSPCILRARTALPGWFIGAARPCNTSSQHGRALRFIRGRK